MTRSAARWATLVAVPTVLIAALGLIAVSGVLDGDGPPAAAGPETTAPTARSTAPVDMPAAPLTERQQVLCRALVSQLPAELRGLAQRQVSAGAEQNAAYGDPAVTVACGGPLPSYAPTDMVYPLDRVCWYAAETSDGTRWTTLDREVPVTVTIPAAYQQPGQWVIEFSTPVLSTVPSAADIPFGCR